MILVDTYEKFTQALEWLHGQEIVAYDIETTGLNVRKDRIIGFGVSSGVDGFYVPMSVHDKSLGQLVELGIGETCVRQILQILTSKKLLCYNASFDLRFTKNALGIDLVPSLHADVMLMKHTCDEEMPFGLKEVGEKLYGKEAVQAREDLKTSIKANGGTAKQFFKADTEIIARYCVQDCLLTYRLYTHYSGELRRQNLVSFFYTDEVLPLYKEVTIPLEEAGIQLDVPLLNRVHADIVMDISKLEQGIQEAIIPHLGIFTTWFLNKDYPLQTYHGKATLWQKSYKTQYSAWEGDLAKNPSMSQYMFNLQSKHHLKKLFFDTLKETPLSRTPTGQPQVNEEFLDKMSIKYDWCKRLIEFNRLSKIKSTYIDRLLQEQEDGRYYPSFMQHRTVSGRYGSDIQQLPRNIGQEGGELVSKYNNIVRSFVTAVLGSKLISADYAQLEPRVFCHVSGDEALKEIFLSGQDFYTTIGCKVLNISELTKKQRQDAKVYALGIPYGLTGYKLQFEIGCTQKEGDKLVQDYFNAFPRLHEWYVRSGQDAIINGEVKTVTGRMRHLSKAKECYERYGPSICDDLQLWHKYNDYPEIYKKAKEDRKTFKNLVNNARNFQIQGLSASIINRAAIAVNRMLRANNLKARLVMNVHDELVYECPYSEVDTVKGIVQDLMENTTKISVPLIALPQVGTNYSECK